MPGELPKEALFAVLGALPLDVTFIDKCDVIRYFSDYRIFNRPPGILGTTVQGCHKPEGRAAVDRVIAELKSGRIIVSEQPADKDCRPVRVRYLAVRDAEGEYLGLVEICEWADGRA